MAKLPAIQFYPGDWRKDVGVQSLTFHDRGVWFEILMLMHESERRGILTLNGKAMAVDALARLLGLDKQILTTTLTMLKDSGVVSVEEATGALMSRRMVRDEQLRATRAECGKLGGNPQLKRSAAENLDKQNATTRLNQIATPSSSLSTSPSGKEAPGQAELNLLYSAYPRKVGKTDALTAIRKAIKRLMDGDNGAPMSLSGAVEFLRQKITRYASTPAGNAGQFTPNPATWFNQGRYLDDEAQWNARRDDQQSAHFAPVSALSKLERNLHVS